MDNGTSSHERKLKKRYITSLTVDELTNKNYHPSISREAKFGTTPVGGHVVGTHATHKYSKEIYPTRFNSTPFEKHT